MRKLFIIIAFLNFLSCEKNPSFFEEKFFDPQKLSMLSLKEVNNFWQDDSIKNISNFKMASLMIIQDFLAVLDIVAIKKRWEFLSSNHKL